MKISKPIKTVVLLFIFINYIYCDNIFTVVAVDQSKCSTDLSKENFYKYAAIYLRPYGSNGNFQDCSQIVSFKTNTNERYKSSSVYQTRNGLGTTGRWYFLEIEDIRYKEFDLLYVTRLTTRGIYLPLVHWSQATTLGKKSLYLHIHPDDKITPGWIDHNAPTRECLIKTIAHVGYKIDLGIIYKNFGSWYLDDVKPAFIYTSWEAACSDQKFNYANEYDDSCPVKTLCVTQPPGVSLIDILKIMHEIYSWIPLPRKPFREHNIPLSYNNTLNTPRFMIQNEN